MFNLFRKQQKNLVKHGYKNLLISLPLHWKYELEGDQEACFDPKSKSTLRFHIMGMIPPEGTSSNKVLQDLTENQPYVTTSNGYLLTIPVYIESIESGVSITIITWRLINIVSYPHIMAVITYTVLTEEKELPEEKEVFILIGNSLQNAELL